MQVAGLAANFTELEAVGLLLAVALFVLGWIWLGRRTKRQVYQELRYEEFVARYGLRGDEVAGWYWWPCQWKIVPEGEADATNTVGAWVAVRSDGLQVKPWGRQYTPILIPWTDFRMVRLTVYDYMGVNMPGYRVGDPELATLLIPPWLQKRIGDACPAIGAVEPDKGGWKTIAHS